MSGAIQLEPLQRDVLHAADVFVEITKDEKKSVQAMSLFYQAYTRHKMGLISLEELKRICANLDFGDDESEKV